MCNYVTDREVRRVRRVTAAGDIKQELNSDDRECAGHCYSEYERVVFLLGLDSFTGSLFHVSALQT